MSLQHKLAVLEQHYNKEKEKIYLQQLLESHPKMAIEYIDKETRYQIICKSCQSCQKLLFNYYSLVTIDSHEIDPTELCIICTHKIMSSRFTQACFTENNSSQIHDKYQCRQKKPDKNWENFLDDYSLNFEYDLEQDSHQQKIQKNKINNHDLLTTKSSPESQNTNQQCVVKIEELKMPKINPILDRLQKIKDSPSQNCSLNSLSIIIRLMVLRSRTKGVRECCESVYLDFFFKSILSHIIFKTYDLKDTIHKGEIKFIYEYWLKSLKLYLEINYGIKIQEYRKRRAELAKKITMSDKAISKLNKGYQAIEHFVGFRKRGEKWNELVNQLRLKTFDFSQLRDIVGERNATIDKKHKKY